MAFPAPEEPVKIDVSQKIMQSMITRTVQASYPEAAASSGASGPVVVAVTVGPNGKILDTKARCGSAALTPAAIESVKEYEFRPVSIDGKPAEVHGDVVVDFLSPTAAQASVPQVTSQDAAGHLLTSTFPKYPPKASNGNVQGCVVVQYEITADGKVQNAKAVDGNQVFLKAAEQCVAEWTYRPFGTEGKTHPVQTYGVVEFSLKKAK